MAITMLMHMSTMMKKKGNEMMMAMVCMPLIPPETVNANATSAMSTPQNTFLNVGGFVFPNEVSIETTYVAEFADVTKKRSEARNLRCFIVACAFVVLYGYNRIHMTNHFLSDVCFGTLITYLIYAVVSAAFMKGLIRNK